MDYSAGHVGVCDVFIVCMSRCHSKEALQVDIVDDGS